MQKKVNRLPDGPLAGSPWVVPAARAAIACAWPDHPREWVVGRAASSQRVAKTYRLGSFFPRRLKRTGDVP